LQDDPLSRVHLRVPQAEGKMLALVQARARVLSRDYQDGFVEMEAQAPESLLRKLRPYVVD
ncbi:MAG: GTPase HflX, partial [Terriglobales bacterium]